jgi:predicted nucleotidyltransferase
VGRVRDELEQILHAQVDLVPASDLKPLVARRVAADLVAL